MSNVNSLHPLRFALGAALAASTLGGCSVDSRSTVEPAEVQVSQLALSTKADPKPASAKATVATTTVASDAASALRAGSTPLKDAGQALDQLASKLEQAAGTGSSTISQRLRAQATALRGEIKTMAGTDQQIERTARALERMHLLMLQAERMERQIRTDAEKLGSAEGGASTSPDGLARLQEQLAALQRSLDAHLAGAADSQTAAQHADQLARDLGAELTKRYGELAASTRQLIAAVDKANGNARALTGVANNIDTLRGNYTAADRTIGSLFDDLILVIQGPTRYNDDWIAQTDPVLIQLEVDIQPYVPQAVADRGSLRVLTYNTAFVSAVVDMPFPIPDLTLDLNKNTFSGLEYTERADKIAEGILRGDQDVVVLNEVFSKEAREELVAKLSPEYPNYVARLGGVPLQSGKTPAQLYLDGVLPDWANDFLKSLQIPGLMEYIVQPGSSGLMVFSRYPLLPLPGPNDADCADEACGFWGWNDGHPLLPDEVAFHIYDHCTPDSSDCLASKGVGLVKLDTPGDPSYVAFTHIQADEETIGENAADRAVQFDEVEDVLVKNIPTSDLFDRRVFFAGDMNVPGRNRDDLKPSEWLDLFAGNGGNMCYACGNGGGICHHDQNGRLFTDPWGFETSTLDPGLSQLNDHERLDYILHNAAGGRACMQYIHIAYDVAENGSHWYSDHLPMREDFNASAGACSANDAAPAPLNRPREVLFTGTNCDFDNNTPAPPCQTTFTSVAPEAKLTHAGSFQWYRITQAGSYSIKLEASDPTKPVDYEVYQGADVSRPIAPFSNEDHPRWGTPYALLEPPYYIRVFAKDGSGKPDRSAASANREYRIDVHQHLCRNAEDACFLQAATKYPYIWPETTNLTNVNELYFKFKTSGVANGHLSPQPLSYPMVRFQEESSVGSNLDCLDPLQLQEWDGVFPPVFVQDHPFTKVETDADNDWDDVDGPDRRYVAPDLDGKKQDEFKFYYVKMNRKQKLECEAPFSTNLRFETDLTYFRGGRTHCYEQYDDSGIAEKDHTRFHLFFDEPADVGSPSFCDTHWCYEAPFYVGGDNWLSEVPSVQGYFVNQLIVGMWENDNGDDMLFNSWQQPISPTPFWERQETLNMYITDNPNPDKADYFYRMEYVLCREKDDCNVAM